MNREGKNAGERYQTLQGIVPDPDLLERLGDLGHRATDPLGMNAVAANIDSGTGRVARQAQCLVSVSCSSYFWTPHGFLLFGFVTFLAWDSSP